MIEDLQNINIYFLDICSVISIYLNELSED